MATQGISTKAQNEGSTRGTGNIVTGETLENNRTAIHVLDKSRATSIGSDVIDSIAGNVITATTHAARAGDLVRMTSGTASGVEFRVFDTDTNTITLETDNPTLAPSAADTFNILRPITQTLSSTGGVTAENTFIRNGSSQVVTEDTATPANNRPLPVKLIGLNGNLEVTAQNLNIQSTHTGANPDSVQLGDGTNLAAVSAALDLQTEDTLGNAILTTIDTDTGNIATDTAVIASDTTSLDSKAPAQGAAVIAASTPVNIASDQTVPVSASSLPLPTGASTSALQTSSEALLTTIDADTSTIATDTTSIDGKTPALGSATSAASVPVVIASDQANVPVSQAVHDSLNVNANLQVGDTDNGTTNPVFTDRLNVVDVLDTPLLDATTLNGSGGALVDVVASLASVVKKVQLLSTAGVFIGLYDDTTLVAQFGPGSDDTVEVSIATTSVIALRSLETAAPAGGSIVVNFLG